MIMLKIYTYQLLMCQWLTSGLCRPVSQVPEENLRCRPNYSRCLHCDRGKKWLLLRLTCLCAASYVAEFWLQLHPPPGKWLKRAG